MKINKVRISNILGIDELEFEAGAFNVFEGANGQGKTSALTAIRSVFQGGQDATLLRNGADKGEVVLVLDDGSALKRRVTTNGTTTSVENSAGVRDKNPGTTIKALTDLMSVNPLDFLRAPDKKKVEVLIDSLPLTASATRLSEILGRPVETKEGDHALFTIASLHKQVFDDRTGTNRAVREKESTINQLAATLPDGAGVDGTPAADAAGLLEQISTIDTAKDTLLSRIARHLDGFRAQYEHATEAARAKTAATVDELQQQINLLTSRIAEEKQDGQGLIDEAREIFAGKESKAAAAREKATADHTAARSVISEQLAVIQAAQSQAAKHDQTRATILKMRAEADSLASDAEKQTAALAALESYKAELLADLPISGLEVRDSAIFRNGVVFDRLNTAQQVEIAIEIAKKRASTLGVICVDGLELLDSAHFAEFKSQALASGLQLFVTRVSDGDFSVSS